MLKSFEKAVLINTQNLQVQTLNPKQQQERELKIYVKCKTKNRKGRKNLKN